MQTILRKENILKRTEEIGLLISGDYQEKELVVVGVLKGSFIFMADLIRAITVPLTCEFLRVSSYEDRRSSGNIRIDFDLTQPVADKHLLLVEDIVDTGQTLRFLLEHLKAKEPASIKVCSLLYKEIDPEVRPFIDYLGFTIPNNYAVGYGMDANGLYRSLPDVNVL